MSAVYIQKLIEVVQGSPERIPLFLPALGVGETVAVTGVSGLRTRVHSLYIVAETDASALEVQVKKGTAILDQKSLPKKTQADFDWPTLATTPWWLDAGEDFAVNLSAAPLKCRVSLMYDQVAE